MPDKTVILIVDKKEENNELRSKLEALNSNFDIYRAYSSEACLKMLKKGKCHIIIINIKLPNMDGIDLFNALKQDPKAKELPIIFYSYFTKNFVIQLGNLKGIDLKSLFESKACDFMLKPVDANLLSEKITNIISA